MHTPSRRQFLKTVAGTAGALLVPRPVPAALALSKIVAVTRPLTQFDYRQVQLLESRFRDQFEGNHKLLLNLDENSLLKPFRQRQGMSAPGPDLGGWYDNSSDFNRENNFHGFIPGHSFGQYLSGLSRAFAVTGSMPTQAKVRRLVRAFGETVEPTGKFYVDYRLPGYTFDKTCCGLIDAHQFAADSLAMGVLKRSTDAVLPHLPEKALSRAEQEARPHKELAYTWDETYTLPENLFLAYRRSGDTRYRDLATRFIYKDYFEALAKDQNALPGKHAYSHVNALSSAMQSYLVLRDEKYLRAASNGLRMVQEQSFATGGWGPNEGFVEPGKGRLAASLKNTHASFETPCGAYGQFKITRYLLRVTRDSRYGDSMEQVLYNTIAGAKPILEDGTSFYYSDYNSGQAKKVYHRDKWPCCSGTFPQLTADYGISAYYSGDGGVYVNLFIPSSLTWSQGGSRCTLIQRTSYPVSNQTEFEFALARPESFSVYLRVPSWADARTRLSVNGKQIEEEIIPGRFLALPRTWKNGDRIEFEISMPLHLKTIDEQNPNTVALMRGPVALFAVGEYPINVTRAELLAASAVSQSSEDWQISASNKKFTLRPFAAISDEPYRLYQDLEPATKE